MNQADGISLNISIKSWQKDSFGLFDFESKDLQKHTLKINSTSRLVREEKIVNEQRKKLEVNLKAIVDDFQSPDIPPVQNLYHQMCRILKQDDGFWLFHKNKVDLASQFGQPEEKLWIVVKDYQGGLENDSYYMPKKAVKLEKNSVIKFGRVRLRVREIDYAPSQTVKKNDIRSSAVINIEEVEIQDKKSKKVSRNKKKDTERDKNVTTLTDEAVCRICWGTEAEDAQGNQIIPEDVNPLISPCSCAGTMGNIHLKCLRGWLETKRTKKMHKGQIILKFKKMDCELCKVNFPFKITYNNQIVDIVDIERPDKNFIVLESLSEESQKIFYVISTDQMKSVIPGQAQNTVTANQQIKIGRGADSDVRVTDDISVSRSHAFIQKGQNGDYYLVDNNSKFGTLMLVQYPIYLASNFTTNPLVVQSGKSILSLQVHDDVRVQSFIQKMCRCLRPQTQIKKKKLISLDKKNFFPKDFFDLNQLKKQNKIQICQEDEQVHPQPIPETQQEILLNNRIDSEINSPNQEEFSEFANHGLPYVRQSYSSIYIQNENIIQQEVQAHGMTSRTEKIEMEEIRIDLQGFQNVLLEQPIAIKNPDDFSDQN